MSLGPPTTMPGLIGRNVASVFAGDGMGIAVGLGSVLVPKTVAKPVMDRLYDWLGKHIVQPHFGFFDKVVQITGLLHTIDEAENEETTLPEKSRAIARELYDLIVSGVTGLAASWGTHRYLDNHVLGLGNSGPTIAKAQIVDKTVHLGSVIVMNSLLSKQTNQLENMFFKILEKPLGKDRARYLARMTARLEVGNFIGAIASIGYMVWKGSATLSEARGKL